MMTIVPKLKHRQWEGHESALCRPLANLGDMTDVPYIVYGHDEGKTFRFPVRGEMTQQGINLQKAEKMGKKHLRSLKPQWRLETLLEGNPGQCSILKYQGAFAPEQIINRSFMKAAHRKLKAKRLAVAIPSKSEIYVTNPDAPKGADDPMLTFIILALTQFAEELAPNRLTPRIFVLEQGLIIGYVTVPDEMLDHYMNEVYKDNDTQVDVLEVDKGDGTIALEIRVSGTSPRHIYEAIKQMTAETFNHYQTLLHFNGKIEVIILADETPPSSELTEIVEQCAQEIVPVIGGVTLVNSGRTVDFSIRYGKPMAIRGDS